LKSDWKITKKLHEMIAYIPEFVVDVLIAEKDNKLQVNVHGTFHLGNFYELSNWGAVNGVNRECKVF
jgi:hypothetical protein